MITSVLLMSFLAAPSGRPSPTEFFQPPVNYPRAVRVTYPQKEYKQVVRTVKEIHFQNLEYHLAGVRFRLRNGSVHKDDRIEDTDVMEHFDLALDHVWYFAFKDGQPEYALVALGLVAVAGSSSDTGFLLLFQVVNDHPVITQQFEYDEQAPGTGRSFDKEKRILTIKARANDGSAHCCPENLETGEFRWHGQTFQLSHRKMEKLLSW